MRSCKNSGSSVHFCHPWVLSFSEEVEEGPKGAELHDDAVAGGLGTHAPAHEVHYF